MPSRNRKHPTSQSTSIVAAAVTSMFNATGLLVVSCSAGHRELGLVLVFLLATLTVVMMTTRWASTVGRRP
jgi:hypothetical protein